MELAGHETRLGRLQRGRGAGWVEALAAPREAQTEVLGCVLQDPRLDRQVEERAAYYAGILLALSAPVDTIRERVRALAAAGADESELWLPIGVLHELAIRGHGGARQGLSDDGVRDRYPELARIDDAPPLHPPGLSPLERWDSLAALTTDRLLELAAAPTTRDGGIALRLLGARDCTVLLDRAVERLGTLALNPRPPGSEHVAWIRYLEHLPPHRVLPLARAWLDRAWPLSLAAERLFADGAEPQDRPRLLATAQEAFDRDDHYRLCSMLDGLAGVADASCVALLLAVCERTTYSYARARALRALSALRSDPRAAASLAEALWDCEPSSRELACEAADLDRPSASDRLASLAADEHEDRDVRDAARRRLATGEEDPDSGDLARPDPG